MTDSTQQLLDKARVAAEAARQLADQAQVYSDQVAQTAAALTIGALKKVPVHHRLTWLPDGVEAMEFLQKKGKFARVPSPDLILLDLGLPRKDGREVLAEIKADPELKGIPVVVMTASTDQADMARSEQLNVESYLTKPVDLDKFMGLVKDLKRFWQADMVVPTGE